MSSPYDQKSVPPMSALDWLALEVSQELERAQSSADLHRGVKQQSALLFDARARTLEDVQRMILLARAHERREGV